MPNDFENTEYFQILAGHGETWHLGGATATETLLARIESMQGLRVLEVGCGSGKTTQQLCDLCAEQVIALDSSPQVLQWARASVDAKSARLLLGCADAHQIPLADHSVDVVIVESMLIFCDSVAVLAEIHRVLKPGGTLLLNELVALNDVILDHLDQIERFIHAPLLTLQTPSMWQEIFQKTGFEVRWQATPKISRLGLFIFLQTLGLVDAVPDHNVLSYQLVHLVALP